MSVPNASDAQAASAAAAAGNNSTIVNNHLANIALLINNQSAVGKTHAIYQILEHDARLAIVAQLQGQGYTVWSAPQPYYPLPIPVPGQNPFTYPFPAFYQYPTVRWDLIYISWAT
jgi:hypothetical protein